ncbi:MAG: proline--tRNA ligase [Clostridia bacterium]|nr:proline--tRNA ligase [Clostridia bacterium]
MAENGKKLVEQITSMDEDFAKWYTDIVKKADLIDYSSVKGCMIIRPYGYAIWENIQKILDERFKATGVENVYMPMFIPESLLTKEKEHVEGFAPEVAWVTMGGSERLTERLCVRPTSETLFCEHYANIVKSYRDLPKVYNQWCSVVRWEKTTRPFLRSREFLWQEGHTMHRTAEEAEERTVQMLNLYGDFFEGDLAMPVLRGQKTDKEKFAGARATYTVEALMHDGKALQGGTSHNFGNGFAEAFGIRFLDSDNTLKYPHQTSWGVSTRIIGGIIMTHGDDSGLVLPPAVAPIQVVIIPIQQQKEGVLDEAYRIADTLKAAGVRVKVDDSDQSPGWKFSEYEMKGVPLRLELGPRDLANRTCVVVRRDNREKSFVAIDDVVEAVQSGMKALRDALYEKALKNREDRTYTADTLEELTEIAANKSGYIRAMWCGDLACELKLKETADVTSRCMPFGAEAIGDRCVCCGREAHKLVYWGKAY